MPYLCIPHAASPDGATIWVASRREPATAGVLRVNGVDHPVPAGGWQDARFPEGGPLRFQIVDVPNLLPRQRYPAELRVGGAIQASCEIGTLPTAVPKASEQRPLRLMLASCFCRIQDEDGAAGAKFREIPVRERPDMKILCGDQVYLDSPTSRFLVPLRRSTLAEHAVENYWRTWSQAGGFQDVLSQGPNWFLSDDHEFWNNAPNGSFAFNSRSQGLRAHWLGVGKELYRIFQNPGRARPVSVPPLSFFFADTRVDRVEGTSQFMNPAHLAELASWIDGLEGPGVVVLGQPVFVERGGVIDRLMDLGLPDYDQYQKLVEALYNARHSIVVLTGDVHFGRVSSCLLPSGKELIEIISSPLSLINALVGGKWHDAPDEFPADDLGITPLKIDVHRFEETDDHFLTLEFTSVGSRVDLEVYVWPIQGKKRFASSHRLT